MDVVEYYKDVQIVVSEHGEEKEYEAYVDEPYSDDPTWLSSESIEGLKRDIDKHLEEASKVYQSAEYHKWCERQAEWDDMFWPIHDSYHDLQDESEYYYDEY